MNNQWHGSHGAAWRHAGWETIGTKGALEILENIVEINGAKHKE